jgi:hypothetical protein
MSQVSSSSSFSPSSGLDLSYLRFRLKLLVNSVPRRCGTEPLRVPYNLPSPSVVEINGADGAPRRPGGEMGA